MEKKRILTKILASCGIALVLLPVAAPIIFALIGLIDDGRFLLDFLMPFELFPIVLAGTGLLIWAAVRAKTRVKMIVWSFVSVIALVLIGQLVAMASGLASGRIEPTGFWWAIVLIIIALAALGIVAVGVGGIFLMRDLFVSKG